MFTIDEQSGKVFITREAIKRGNYQVGDRFILTLSVESHTSYDTTVENAVCQLSVRLTDKDYTFVLPMSRFSLDRILFEYLNPLRERYLPRTFEADGVKIAVQDLIEPKTQQQNEAPKTEHYLLVQVETANGLKPVDLDLFADMWKNYSKSNKYFDEFREGLIERRPESKSSHVDIAKGGFGHTSHFYGNWLFWLLALIAVLLFGIMIFFVLGLKKTKKQQYGS